MKITGHEFLKALNDFFSGTNPATETFLLLLLEREPGSASPALLILPQPHFNH